MEDNEKRNENPIDPKAESNNVDSNVNAKQSDTREANNTTTDPNQSPANHNEQTTILIDDSHCSPAANNKSTENSKQSNVDQQQVPTSSTESSDLCSNERRDEKVNCESPPVKEESDSTVPVTITENATVKSSNESNNDHTVNDLASSSVLLEVQSDCRTETKPNIELVKSEIINELTTASIANCDSSEILDDSIMNVIHSNSSNNVSDSHGDNVETAIPSESSSPTTEKGAKAVIDKSSDEKLNESGRSLMSSEACSIDALSLVGSTDDVNHSNGDKLQNEPTSSGETGKVGSDSDDTPSVHPIISDKGGGTDNQNADISAQQQPAGPANTIVLNNSVDSINCLVDTNDPTTERTIYEVNKLDEHPEIDMRSTTIRTEEKIGCDSKHSSNVQNPVAYSGSVIRLSTVAETSDDQRDNINVTSNTIAVDHLVRSKSISHIELPKSSSTDTSIASMKLNQKSPRTASPNDMTLDLTQSHSLSGRPNSLYVSNPDFTRPKPSTEDLSSLRMKPPDFSKITHAYSTNNLKIPNPNFNEMETSLKQHQPSHQTPINPANFAEISKRRNYISDLQLKTSTTPSTQASSFDRSLDGSRSMSNLYVKTPDFSSQKKKCHDSVDEPIAHVIHKNPYPIQTEKSSIIIAPPTATVATPSDPSIIYRSYPQISQDVTMSIVPTQSVPLSQHQQQQHQHLSQKQSMAEPQPSNDQRFRQQYPSDMHKGHPSMYPSTVLTAPHNLYESRIHDVLHPSNPLNASYKEKVESDSIGHPHQRESSRAAVIQSGKSITVESDVFNQRLQSTYNQPSYYEKPIGKPVVASQPLDYIQSQQQFTNSRYTPDLHQRMQPNKLSYERPGYSESNPGMYQDHYKQPPQSVKHTSGPQMAAPSNRPSHPVMNSKPIDIPSSGHMNPPQYWPSHSPRISQSPISLSSSPLSGRVTQSPAGASPSPQHHVMQTPSSLPAQSPTYRYSSPNQTQPPTSYNIPTTASSPTQFKDTVNSAIYQKPSKSKSSKSLTKRNVPQQSGTPNYYYLPPETTHFPGHQYSIKVEQPTHYPPNQYSNKTDNNLRDDTRSKQNKSFPDYVDLTKPLKTSDIPSPHLPNLVAQQSRYDHRHSNERHESYLNHRSDSISNKHAQEPSSANRSLDKHNMFNSQQKTIMDPYAYRKASEADLNYEIIKKTLNKDISIRRSDTDLSCSIFDTPKLNQSKNVVYPTSNDQFYGRGSSYHQSFNYPQQPAEATIRRDMKGNQIVDGNRYYSGSSQPTTKIYGAEHVSRSKPNSVDSNSLRPPNDLKKHDLSVTVSRIGLANSQSVEQARLQHSETTIQPTTSRHQSTAQVAKTHLLQPQPNIPQKPTSTSVKTVLTPVKRESPLDLSVKTVKTKADSTGDDYAVPSSSRDYNTPLSLKVDFSPNFQKHTRVCEKSTANHISSRHEHPTTNTQYPSLPIQRPTSQQSTSQNVPQKNTDKLQDVRYQQYPHHLHGLSTYVQFPAPTPVAPSTQSRSHQLPSDSFKHQSKPVLNPTVPTVFGRKPEELKNLPINPESQDCKTAPSAFGSYENDNRLSKNRPLKSNYHNKLQEHVLISHNKPHETSVKYSDFKTKDSQNVSIPNSSVETIKDRPPYPYATTEKPEYMAQYQNHRTMPVQSRIVEHVPQGHYDPHCSRKRQADPPIHNQYPKSKQVRPNEPPNQHFYHMDERYPPAADSKSHDRFEMPAEKIIFHPRFATANYQRVLPEQNYSSVRAMPPNDTEPNEMRNTAAAIRDNISPNYNKQYPYHYPETMHNPMESKPTSHPPIISYPTEQHEKHLAYQKSKKEMYNKVPSPAEQNCYPRDSKHHPYENYNSEPYQSYKNDAKPYYNDVGYPPSQQYPKQGVCDTPQQVYQQPWPTNQPTLQPDSSKQSYCPSSEIRNREFNPMGYTPRPSSDVAVRPNVRLNSITTEQSTSRQPTTLKGADQTVISKLRTNLEMKEIEKQKLLRNQSSTETVDEENPKSDIASLIAARIRTKGELKGFTPMPTSVPEPKSDASNQCDVENMKEKLVPVTVCEPGGDSDNATAFDLLDWGSACNDFVEQLKGTGTKKRGRRRRGKSLFFDTEFETVGQDVPLQNLPGVDYKCDIDENVASFAKTVNQEDETPKKDEGSSSDEDKPLLFLRQKSLNETGKLKASQSDDVVNDSSTLSETTRQAQKRAIVFTKLTDKISKNKKEQQREKRENEKRISIASSSESDGDVSPKINKRPKKTVRKPRTRSSVGYQNASDDETSENGSKNSKRTNDHTKRKKSAKSSSDSEPLKRRTKTPRIDSDDKSDNDDDKDCPVKYVAIKQEVISDDDESDCKMEVLKTPVKKEPGVINVKIEETMTRSKRKQELERQKANSKVLRNDKMVKNVSVFERKSYDSKKGAERNSQRSKCKTLCKDDGKRKFDDTETTGESSKNDSAKKKGCRNASVQSISSDSDENEELPLTRRRTRSAKSMDQRTPEKIKNAADKVVEKKWSRNSPQKKALKEPTTKPSIEQFPPGWENEVYEFKRSLKIPASLITIKKPSWYRKSISLPDLDPHSSDTSETFSEKKQLFLKPFSELSDRKPTKKEPKQSHQTNTPSTNVKTTAEAAEKVPNDIRSTSIIDRLHQKIIPPINRNSKKARLLHSNEPKLLPQSNEIELLSTPGSENVFKHQSVFETAVLNSRTRKEYRTQKNQEIIREVFGCDDRPASAPPLHAVDKSVPAITFDQKYKQYLEKMNMDFGDSKEANCEITADVSIVKQEKMDDDSLLNDDETQDTEINDCERNALDIKDEPIDSNERDTPSVSEREGITPSSLSLIRKRGRGARGGRRKGSSGFDYIRKKKKPLTQPAEGGQQKRRSAAINYLQEKDENDINREIRGWVLNKGVGETVLHKAARLGYIDVIAFCLQRLEMNPDQKDNAGYTALHEACSRGHLDIARLLLEYGANHSETAVLGGIRPLHEAVENGYIEVVRLLLSYGADPLLATYSGQTPIMLAENDDPMIAFLKSYLNDIQNTGPNKMPWKFEGPWKKYDPDEYGYNMFDGVPIDENDAKADKLSVVAIKPESNLALSANVGASKQVKESKCDSNSNIMLTKSATRKRPPNAITSPENHRNIKSKYKNLSPCTVVLTNLTDKNNTKANGADKPTAIPSLSTVSLHPDSASEQPEIIEFSDDDSDADFFEIEESQAPHVPLYHLRDEGAVKWALLSDLCYMLKVKSKDTLLKQICSSMPPSAGSNKELLRELKMGDFLERATCLQLLCAGEKLNIRASKVVLVKYNDSVKNLLGIKTVLMKM
ncbi:uncharacterized protein LOC119084801 [Bradysia coprophila]|uniref:uncharacterized protein LOC119084801 n=1 Tax=Bradysia coprophila TaxID=38358 RepID=UPI00187D984C|nr:uncharacterized protein LOC119084801 [Bradysia coprophila]